MPDGLSKTPVLQPPPSRESSVDDAPIKRALSPFTSNNTKPQGEPREPPQPPAKPQTLPSTTSQSAAMPLALAGTLSWQQRPTSRGSTGAKGRPLSMFASENNAARSPRATPEPSTAKDDNISRSQIAQSLGSRDPSWFKQTQERGLSSAAFRKNQVEEKPGVSPATAGMRLPGMSRENSTDPERCISPAPESVRSNSPSWGGSRRGVSGIGHKSSTSTSSTPSISSMRSPIPARSSQRLEPPSSDSTSRTGDDDTSGVRGLAMSPSQGRISPERIERPSSPTKGLGGFVQSAMLKRSDSVNKRWSAQNGPGLSRGNSVASNISGYGTSRYPVGGITPLTESRQDSTSREVSPTSNSRPGSSHSAVTVTQTYANTGGPGTAASVSSRKTEAPSTGRFANPVAGDETTENVSSDPVMSPPTSPSKRWSPTKSSWLENAINKPDLPKVKSPAPSQPSWMAEINKSKQQRGSVDPGKRLNFKEVSIGGLVRSPPPGSGYKPPTIGGLPNGFSAGIATKSRNGSIDDINEKRDSAPSAEAGDPVQQPKIVAKALDQGNEGNFHSSRSRDASPKPISTTSPPTKPKKPPSDPSAKAPPASKSKPNTPPKKDFKSDLKPSQSPEAVKTKDEPEFKNVFGNLKRTQTKNYVAPDELKDNILRGKNGLVQTRGPKKSERRDEFRESILQKKQGMATPSASTRITSAASKNPDQSTPEAIAKMKALSRSDSLQSNGTAERPSSTPKEPVMSQGLRDKPKVESPIKLSVADPSERLPKAGLGGNFTASLAGILQKGPPPLTSKNGPPQISSQPDVISAANQKDQEAPLEGPQLTHATKARARGPKRRLPTAVKQEEPIQSQPTETEAQNRSLTNESQGLSPIKPPKSRSTTLSPNNLEPRPLSSITGNNNNNNRKVSQPTTPRKPTTTISKLPGPRVTLPRTDAATLEVQPKASPPVKQKPATSPKDRNTRGLSDSTSISSVESSARPTIAEQIQSLPSRTTAGQDLNENDAQPPSVKGAAATWGKPDKSTPQARAKSPIKLPSRKDEEALMEEAGLSVRERDKSNINTPVKQPQPLAKALSPKSPPMPGKKPSSIADTVVHPKIQPPIAPHSEPSSPIRGAPLSDTETLFADIFDESPSAKHKITVDTHSIIENRTSNDSSSKIKTLRKQIYEITGNGKTVPVPSHQEHILFEESLYLCTHIFGNHAGQRITEVYLWCGDAVPSSVAEDAHLFAKKFAKDNNGRLVVLKQGKETPNFFLALGGIVITRRGSSNRAESSPSRSANYMLCGRQHVGQIAFDEVDYSPRSLCKGFPFIVSAPQGKLYLWKGSGSGVDELGCARLIGMDLGATGEIEEVDEGQEPPAFWAAFPVSQRAVTGQEEYWHRKPSCEKYTNRLFSVAVEAARPKSASSFIQGAIQWGRRGSAPANDSETTKAAQIREVSPFAQSDLGEEGGVFVLDAFFELFV